LGCKCVWKRENLKENILMRMQELEMCVEQDELTYEQMLEKEQYSM
jgi:hypothetical protein